MLNVQFTFTFMHLAEAFIQSDLQCIQAIHLYCQLYNYFILLLSPGKTPLTSTVAKFLDTSVCGDS